MNFDKHFNEYDNYSFVQKKVAKNLVEYMNKNKVFQEKLESVFEIGCGTGIFTREYKKNCLNLKELVLNDKFDVRNFIDDIEYSDFIEGNIENLEIKKSDLILSSSVFQWIKNLDKLFKKISVSTSRLCFSTYIFGNLIEIKNHFGISLKYKQTEEIEEILKKHFSEVSCQKETIKLEFENPLELLKHLKYTGVTGLEKPTSVTKIRKFKNKILTYEVGYFICKK